MTIGDPIHEGEPRSLSNSYLDLRKSFEKAPEGTEKLILETRLQEWSNKGNIIVGSLVRKTVEEAVKSLPSEKLEDKVALAESIRNSFSSSVLLDKVEQEIEFAKGYSTVAADAAELTPKQFYDYTTAMGTLASVSVFVGENSKVKLYGEEDRRDIDVWGIVNEAKSSDSIPNTPPNSPPEIDTPPISNEPPVPTSDDSSSALDELALAGGAALAAEAIDKFQEGAKSVAEKIKEKQQRRRGTSSKPDAGPEPASTTTETATPEANLTPPEEVKESEEKMATEWHAIEKELRGYVDLEFNGVSLSEEQKNKIVSLITRRNEIWSTVKGEHDKEYVREKTELTSVIRGGLSEYRHEVNMRNLGDTYQEVENPLKVIIDSIEERVRNLNKKEDLMDVVAKSWWDGAKRRLELVNLEAEQRLRVMLKMPEKSSLNARVKRLTLEANYLNWGNNSAETMSRWDNLISAYSEWLVTYGPLEYQMAKRDSLTLPADNDPEKLKAMREMYKLTAEEDKAKDWSIAEQEFLRAHYLPDHVYVTDSGPNGTRLLRKDMRTVLADAFTIGHVTGITKDSLTTALIEQEEDKAKAEGREVDYEQVTKKARESFDQLQGGIFKLIQVRLLDQGTFYSLIGNPKSDDPELRTGVLNQAGFNLRNTVAAFDRDEKAKSAYRMWLGIKGQAVGDLRPREMAFISKYAGEIRDMMSKDHNQLLHRNVEARMKAIGEDMRSTFPGMDMIRVGLMQELSKLTVLGPELVDYRKLINTHQVLWNPSMNPQAVDGRTDESRGSLYTQRSIANDVEVILRLERDRLSLSSAAAKKELAGEDATGLKNQVKAVENQIADIQGEYDPIEWIPKAKERAAKNPLAKIKHGELGGTGFGYLAKATAEKGVDGLFKLIATYEEADTYDPNSPEASLTNAKPIQGMFLGYRSLLDDLDTALGNFREGKDDFPDETVRKGEINKIIQPMAGGDIPKFNATTLAAMKRLPTYPGKGKNYRAGERRFMDLSRDAWRESEIGKTLRGL